MHPALSVIFFTTASGAGYGLLALLGLLGASGTLPADRWFGLAGLILALGAFSLGLLSSTFHLGHPERAWRALTQWRSSWLAREGVMAVLTYIPAVIFAFGWIVHEDMGGIWGAAGTLAAIGGILTVICTSMIYRQLKPIHQWHNSYVIPSYLILGLMTGAVFLNVLIHLFGIEARAVEGVAIAALALGWIVKTCYWRFIDTTQALSTPNTATGLRGGAVKLIDHPHTQANYLMKEMGFQIARKHAVKLRLVAHILGFAAPLALTVLALYGEGILAGFACLAAALSVSVGIVAERWLFFAQAKHTVTLYYGAAAA